MIKGKYFFVFAFLLIPLQSLAIDTLFVNIFPNKQSASDIQSIINKPYNNRYVKFVFQPGNLSLNRPIYTSRENLIFEFSPNTKLNLLSNINGGILVRHNNVRISGAKIMGNGKSANDIYNGFGVLVDGVNGVMIEKCTFQKISGVSIFLNKGKNGCKNVIVKGNRITDPAFDYSKNGDESGILIGYSSEGYSHDNNIIEDNTIDGANKLKIGIGLIGHGTKNVIRKNKIYNCLEYGIVAYESIYTDSSLSYTSIIGNHIENIAFTGYRKTKKGMGIYLMKSNYSLVKDNYLVNLLKDNDKSETLGSGAITLNGSFAANVSNNKIVNSFMYGITNALSFSSNIDNNSISDIKKSAIYLINVNNVNIKNNTIDKIDGVVFKGFFEHTSLSYIKDMFKTTKYNDLSTGNYIMVSNNTIKNPNKVLDFSGTPTMKLYKNKKSYKGNIIRNNSFINNTIISPRNKGIIFRYQDNNKNYVSTNNWK